MSNRPVKQRKYFKLSLDIKNTGSSVFEGGSIYNLFLHKPGEKDPQCLDKGGPALSIPKIIQGGKIRIEIGNYRISQAGVAKIETNINALNNEKLVICSKDEVGEIKEIRNSRSLWIHTFEVFKDNRLNWAIFWVALLTLLITSIGLLITLTQGR